MSTFAGHLRPSEPQGEDILQAERDKSSLDSEGLSLYLFGRAYLESQSRILQILREEKIFDKKDDYFKGNTELKFPMGELTCFRSSRAV